MSLGWIAPTSTLTVAGILKCARMLVSMRWRSSALSVEVAAAALGWLAAEPEAGACAQALTTTKVARIAGNERDKLAKKTTCGLTSSKLSHEGRKGVSLGP